MSFWQKLYHGFWGFLVGSMLMCCLFTYTHGQSEADRLREQLPEVREVDAKQLPPGARNLKGLGNRWILFEMEVDGKPQKFIFRRAYYRDQPDILVHVP